MLETHLSAALDALAQRNSALALQLLIVGWRECHNTRLSNAILDLSARISSNRPPVEGEGSAWHQAWVDREAAGDPLDVDVLGAGLVVPPFLTLVVRVEKLIRRGADPRVSRALFEILRLVPTTALSNYSVYKAVFTALSGPFRDPQYKNLLIERAGVQVGGDTFWSKFEPALARLVVASGDEDELSDRESMILGLVELAIPNTRPVPIGEGVALWVVGEEKEVVEEEPSENTMEAALSAWKTGKYSLCLGVLVRVWQRHRTGELGELVEALSRRIPVRCLEGIKVGDRQSAWSKLEEKRDLADLPVLLETLGEGTVSVFEERLRKLMTWPADPRIGSRVFESVRCNWYSQYRVLLWKVIGEIFAIHGDARLIGFLNENNTPTDKSLNRLSGELRFLKEAMKIEPLSEAARSQLDQIQQGVSALLDIEAGLVAAISEDLSSNEARLVYGDYLMERNDPRGELIMLQCGKPIRGQAKRLKDLLANTKALLGPLEDLILPKTAVFERGLLTQLTLAVSSTSIWDAYKDDPRLVGVTAIAMGWHNGIQDIRQLYEARWLRHLEDLRGLSAARLAQLIEYEVERQDQGHPGLMLTRLGFSAYGGRPEKLILSERSFPNLKKAFIHGWNNQISPSETWIWDLPFLRRVEELEFEVAPNALETRATLYARACQLSGPLERIAFVEWGNRNPMTITRFPDHTWPPHL